MSHTQNFRVILQYSLSQLRSIYRTGYDHAKAEVMISELAGETDFQRDMFELRSDNEGSDGRAKCLGAVMGEIN